MRTKALGEGRLASAILLGDEQAAFIAYHERLTSAARATGLIVVTPGQDPGSS